MSGYIFLLLESLSGKLGVRGSVCVFYLYYKMTRFKKCKWECKAFLIGVKSNKHVLGCDGIS